MHNRTGLLQVPEIVQEEMAFVSGNADGKMHLFYLGVIAVVIPETGFVPPAVAHMMGRYQVFRSGRPGSFQAILPDGNDHDPKLCSVGRECLVPKLHAALDSVDQLGAVQAGLHLPGSLGRADKLHCPLAGVGLVGHPDRASDRPPNRRQTRPVPPAQKNHSYKDFPSAQGPSPKSPLGAWVRPV